MADQTLQEWLRAQCNRHVNGACTTGRCLRRGGWVPGGPQSADDATCEAHEAADALDTKDAEIARLLAERDIYDAPAWQANERLNALVAQMADEITDLRDRLTSAENALRETLSLLAFEINPSNYDHEDVCLLNDNSIRAYHEASYHLTKWTS